MAKIKIKNSVTAGSAPSGLSFGEMAVNITDKKIFIGNAVEGVVTLHDQQNVVTSINGSTGAITNVAQTNAANVFTALQSFNSGISANGGTFSNQLNAQNLRMLAVGGDEGGQIDFNLPATNTSLTGGVSIDVFQNKVRIFESGGTNRGVFIDLSGVSAGVGTNLVGGGGGGAVSSVSGSGNGISVSPTTGAVVVRNTGVHSFNGVTGDVVGVSSVNGQTGAVTNLNASTITTSSLNTSTIRYLTFVGGTGSTAVFIDDVTTPLTYTPSGGAIGAKKITLTTSANVITVDSATPNFTITDGIDVVDYGIVGIGANNATPFEISNPTGLTLNVTNSSIQFLTGTGSYVFPNTNGSNGQVLTTNGSGTLTWQTPSSGLSWTAVTADQTMAVDTGYLANKSSGTLTLTLPTTSAVGKTLRVSGMQNTWRIAQNASQKIHFGKITSTTGVGGYLENTNAKDSVELVCAVANLEWNVISSIGNITIV